jgi:hypothetical protein
MPTTKARRVSALAGATSRRIFAAKKSAVQKLFGAAMRNVLGYARWAMAAR